MINEEVLKEKLSYLIRVNSAKWFDITDVYVDFEYVDKNENMLSNYELDITFDYHGAIGFDLSTFTRDIEIMSDKLKNLISEFVINQEGKIVSGKNSNCYTTEPMIFNIEFEADMKHKFVLGYRFHYE